MDFDFNIIAEEKDFIIINKPAGQNIQSDATPGFIQALRQSLNDSQLSPVHRLGKETTGLLIIAKGAQASSHLSHMFENNQIDKFYWAISDKTPKKKLGEIRGDMIRNSDGTWRVTKTTENPAITQFYSYGLGSRKQLFLIRIQTGKVHQIRAVLKSLGSPVLGDTRYGGSPSDRLYLHAGGLRFQYMNRNYAFVYEPEVGEFFVNSQFKSIYRLIGNPLAHHWSGPLSSCDTHP